MRGIKFRAWDKFEKKMIDEPIIDGKNGLAMGFSLLDGSFQRHFSKEKLAIMQYTGLKDVNGVEIYEGDVVKGLDPLRDEWIGEIKYLAPYYALLGSRSHLILSDVNNLEIIGNIYDNPELLGDAK